MNTEIILIKGKLSFWLLFNRQKSRAVYPVEKILQVLQNQHLFHKILFS